VSSCRLRCGDACRLYDPPPAAPRCGGSGAIVVVSDRRASAWSKGLARGGTRLAACGYSRRGESKPPEAAPLCRPQCRPSAAEGMAEGELWWAPVGAVLRRA